MEKFTINQLSETAKIKAIEEIEKCNSEFVFGTDNVNDYLGHFNLNDNMDMYETIEFTDNQNVIECLEWLKEKNFEIDMSIEKLSLEKINFNYENVEINQCQTIIDILENNDSFENSILTNGIHSNDYYFIEKNQDTLIDLLDTIKNEINEKLGDIYYNLEMQLGDQNYFDINENENFLFDSEGNFVEYQ